MEPNDNSMNPPETHQDDTIETSENQSASIAQTLSPPTEIPLSLTVEADKIAMTLEQLLNLKPGNIIETTLTPDSEVHLTLQGKAIAKGILIQYGDVTGIKITKLG